MRLTKLRRHVRSPEERERRISVGKLLYFLVLGVLLVLGVRYGAERVLHVRGQGFIRGEKVAVQALHRARILAIGPAVNDRVTEGEVVARLSADRGPTTVHRPAAATRPADLKAEELRLRARLQDERETEADRIRSRAEALETDLWKTRERLGVLQARVESERALSAAREDSIGHWRRLYELEAITLPEYLRRVQEVDAGASSAEVELTGLRNRERRLQDAIETTRRDLDRVRGRRETRARLATVLEEEKQLVAAPPAPAATVGPVDTGGALLAPQSGVLATLLKKPGEVLLPGETLGEIVDPERLYVEAFFPADQQQYLFTGEEVEVRFPSGTQGNGRVAAIDPVVTPLAPAYQKRYEPPQTALRVRIRLEEPERYLQALDAQVQVRVSRFALR